MADIHELSVGQVVFSKCGRDKGKAFIITALDADFAYIVDGQTRRLEKPKKKKLKHLQPVKHVDETIRAGMGKPSQNDADFRKALMPYTKRDSGSEDKGYADTNDNSTK